MTNHGKGVCEGIDRHHFNAMEPKYTGNYKEKENII